MSNDQTRKKRGRPARGATATLDREQIVAAALRLIDEKGLEGFSLREVARLLDVFPTALYWHLPGGRNALLAEVAAIAFDDVATPFCKGDTDWESWLRTLFHRYRASLRRHPNIAPLLGAQLVSNAGVNPELVERILCALQAAGFQDAKLVDAYNAVVAALLGYVTLELAPEPAEDATGWAAEFEGKIRSLDRERYPLLTGNLDRLANKAFIVRWQGGADNPLSSGFEFYVETVIAGLKQLASR